MSWWDSLLQIDTPNDKGSGTLISANEVLTAAHVVSPNGNLHPLVQLRLDLRFRQQVVAARNIAVLPGWAGGTADDWALIRIDPLADSGLGLAFGLPAAGATRILTAAGFVASTDAFNTPSGSVECRVTASGDRFLYTQDFAPIPGMSGGPVCCADASGAVQVAGIITRNSPSGFIGLSNLQSVISDLRQILA